MTRALEWGAAPRTNSRHKTNVAAKAVSIARQALRWRWKSERWPAQCTCNPQPGRRQLEDALGHSMAVGTR